MAEKMGISQFVHKNGTYCFVSGPTYESKAESRYSFTRAKLNIKKYLVIALSVVRRISKFTDTNILTHRFLRSIGGDSVGIV